MSSKVTALVKRGFRFGLTSGAATLVDFLLFRFVFYFIFPIFYAEILANLVGMVINFILQKRFVFNMKRKQWAAFGLALGTSIIVMLIGAFTIQKLEGIPWFKDHITITKILVIGMKFVFNFFLKQWAFEKRFLPEGE